MGIGVASQQGDLEEQQARRPYSWTSAKPGQNVLAYKGLHLEEQKRAEKDGQRAGEHIAFLLVGLQHAVSFGTASPICHELNMRLTYGYGDAPP